MPFFTRASKRPSSPHEHSPPNSPPPDRRSSLSSHGTGTGSCRQRTDTPPTPHPSSRQPHGHVFAEHEHAHTLRYPPRSTPRDRSVSPRERRTSLPPSLPSHLIPPPHALDTPRSPAHARADAIGINIPGLSPPHPAVPLPRRFRPPRADADQDRLARACGQGPLETIDSTVHPRGALARDALRPCGATGRRVPERYHGLVADRHPSARLHSASMFMTPITTSGAAEHPPPPRFKMPDPRVVLKGLARVLRAQGLRLEDYIEVDELLEAKDREGEGLNKGKGKMQAANKEDFSASRSSLLLT
ncbi:hypothetical protein B0H21DRAFT_768623, partial [Amylocystis lapponica]